jgi:hypothetical protein
MNELAEIASSSSAESESDAEMDADRSEALRRLYSGSSTTTDGTQPSYNSSSYPTPSHTGAASAPSQPLHQPAAYHAAAAHLSSVDGAASDPTTTTRGAPSTVSSPYPTGGGSMVGNVVDAQGWRAGGDYQDAAHKRQRMSSSPQVRPPHTHTTHIINIIINWSVSDAQKPDFLLLRFILAHPSSI